MSTPRAEGSAWNLTLPFAEFWNIVRELRLADKSKQLSKTEVFGIFFNVQQGSPSTTTFALEADSPDASSSATPSNSPVSGASAVLSGGDSASIIYPEFLQAVAALASYVYPNPYLPLSSRLEGFLERTFLPWARLHNPEASGSSSSSSPAGRGRSPKSNTASPFTPYGSPSLTAVLESVAGAAAAAAGDEKGERASQPPSLAQPPPRHFNFTLSPFSHN